MNLGKLLAAGKSVMGGRRQVPYHVVEHAFLPQFISPKNPFTPPAKAEAPPVAMPATKETAADEKKIPKMSALPAARSRRKTWLGKLKPISFWREPVKPGPQKPQCPRQAELSLDRVKVVHNDLSDVDVEVVPIKSRRTPETEEPAPVHGSDSWSRWSAKIFGVKAA